jgi:23S rRNA (pseudouridine1915-N3)-methyltransferase
MTARLRVIAVGRDRSGLYAPAVEEYAKRLARYARFELVEVPEARRHAGTPRARDEEGESLLAKVRPGERVVALDERGDAPATAEFAERVGHWLAGAKDVALLVGGSDGLSGAVLERADERLALSRLTLAHRLARLVLVEQLYRAMTILRGEPYHK